MKKIKETIFYFHGVNTNSLLARDSLTTIFNSTILNQYVNTINVGDPENGYTYQDIANCFKSNEVLGSYNIFLSMHGSLGTTEKPTPYSLSMNILDFSKIEEEIRKENAGNESTSIEEKIKMAKYYYSKNKKKPDMTVVAKDFFKNLKELSDNKPLNIFVNSCFGANIHKDVDILPIGSKVISCSDEDKSTLVSDGLTSHIAEVYDILFSPGQGGYLIEKLMLAYCFTQKFHYNTPIFSKVTENGVVKTALDNLLEGALKASDNIAISHSLTNLLKVKGVTVDEANKLIGALKTGKTCKDFKYTNHIDPYELIKNVDNNTLDSYIKQFAQYFKLESIDLNLLKQFVLNTKQYFKLARELFGIDQVTHSSEVLKHANKPVTDAKDLIELYQKSVQKIESILVDKVSILARSSNIYETFKDLFTKTLDDYYASITTANERFKKDMKENPTIADTYITEFTGKQLANEAKTREAILLVAKLLLSHQITSDRENLVDIDKKIVMPIDDFVANLTEEHEVYILQLEYLSYIEMKDILSPLRLDNDPTIKEKIDKIVHWSVMYYDLFNTNEPTDFLNIILSPSMTTELVPWHSVELMIAADSVIYD